MGDCKNFRRRGQAQKDPHLEKKVAKRPPHGEKGQHNEKTVAKRPSYSPKNLREFSRGADRLLLPPTPLRAPINNTRCL